ncbi:glycosyltransferase 87 family protein [Frondihabitans australicus]|uniref:Uncharacterized protein DUF2029 n=1 Tax=Frondihabitans australicus TaxID=386892 RepID=A0A495IE18_9MICO|nr:glycosyltransferase 87 family protein [Frondihabitans australicus]RKR73738.1 uncharacterized protein DUF2029 [Frondihabitans australicus]
MTTAPGRAQPAPRSPIALFWAAFVGVHLCLWVLEGVAPHTPLNDVSQVYYDWVDAGLHGSGWVGVTLDWVYPSAALLPMLAAAGLGLAHYTTTWLALVTLLDAAAIAFVTRGGTSRREVGYWWLAFLLLLGPIALGRLDSVSVPLAIVGLLYAVRRPVVAGVLVGLATWIKVWPAALALALLVAVGRRIRVAIGLVGVSLATVLAVLLLGGSTSVVLSFVGQQTGRALQIEAPVTTWWLWQEALHVPGTTTAFDWLLLTYQVSGPGAVAAARAMTPIMGVAMLGVAVLGVRAVRGGARPVHVLAPLALAFTAAFIVTNKVGSPQYQTWIAAPVILGLLLARRGGGSFVVPARLALVIAALTQVIYPWAYDPLVAGQLWIVAVITVRNALVVALLGFAVVRLWHVGAPAIDRVAVPTGARHEADEPVTG